jgi:hypothetical protein
MSLNDPPGEFFDEISSSVGSEIVVSHRRARIHSPGALTHMRRQHEASRSQLWILTANKP